MRVKYYKDTDTLYIEFRDVPVKETRDLDENTLLELDERRLPEAVLAGVANELEHFDDRPFDHDAALDPGQPGPSLRKA